MAKTPSVGARLDPDLKKGLEDAADAMDRSVSWIISQACSRWLADWRRQQPAETDSGGHPPARSKWRRKNS